MNDILRDLLLNGLMIYPNNGKFVLKKEAIPSNTFVFPESEHDTYELALEAAKAILYAPQETEWSVIVRYNRGLGIEYKNLPDVRAATKEEAKTMADALAQTTLGQSVAISEVRVMLKK